MEDCQWAKALAGEAPLAVAAARLFEGVELLGACRLSFKSWAKALAGEAPLRATPPAATGGLLHPT